MIRIERMIYVSGDEDIFHRRFLFLLFERSFLSYTLIFTQLDCLKQVNDKIISTNLTVETSIMNTHRSVLSVFKELSLSSAYDE